MIKKMAWNTFKNTGSIDSYLELVEVENIEKNIVKNNITNEELKTEVKKDFNLKGEKWEQ